MSHLKKQNDFLNRFKNVAKKNLAVAGIIYEDVISAKMYERLKDLSQIPSEPHTDEGLNEKMKEYYDGYYGTFIEKF